MQTVVDSLGGTLTFDANGGENLNGYLVSRTFVASDPWMVFTFFPGDPTQSLNLIAMTNEAAGTGYSTPVALTDVADSDIYTSNCYTHTLAFAATAQVTVNDVVFTAAGQSGSNWTLTAWDPNTRWGRILSPGIT